MTGVLTKEYTEKYKIFGVKQDQDIPDRESADAGGNTTEDTE